MKRRGSSRKVAPGLVALSSAAILTIYSAGFVRTRAASERFADDGAKRRVVSPPEASPVALPEGPAPSAGTSSPPSVHAIFAAPATPAQRQASAPSSPVSAAADETPAPVPDAIEPAKPRLSTSAVAPTENVYKDGTFSGWGTSRHGDIQASVVVEGGRIASAVISQCLTRYSCSWISNLPPQVVGRQSADVDYVSGATQSTNAFYYAILEALSKAK